MMKIKRTLVGLLVMALLIGTGFAPATSVQASSKVGTTTAKVKNTPVGADLKVTWSAVDGASGYEVYMATSKSGKYKHVKTTTGISYTTSNVKKDKTYYFKVRAYKTIVTTEPSVTLEPVVTTEPAVTTKPVIKKEKKYGNYSKVVSGKTCKYLLNTVIDEGGEEVYFYWLWDGKTAMSDKYFWDAFHKCEDILIARYDGKTNKKCIGSSKKKDAIKYSMNGKVLRISTPHI